MNKYLFLAAIFATLILSSCKNQDSITQPTSVSGKFVVDSIGTTISVKTDTVSKNLHTFIVFRLVYHYENYSGNLDQIEILEKNSYGVITAMDYLGPDSIKVLHRFNWTYNIPDSLKGLDSIMVIHGLSGSFWDKSGVYPFVYIGKFSWKDSLYVHIER